MDLVIKFSFLHIIGRKIPIIFVEVSLVLTLLQLPHCLKDQKPSSVEHISDFKVPIFLAPLFNKYWIQETNLSLVVCTLGNCCALMAFLSFHHRSLIPNLLIALPEHIKISGKPKKKVQLFYSKSWTPSDLTHTSNFWTHSITYKQMQRPRKIFFFFLDSSPTVVRRELRRVVGLSKSKPSVSFLSLYAPINSGI